MKVNAETASAQIGLFHVQIQEIRSRSTTKRKFVFLPKFIIGKYLKQEVGDDLSVCIDEELSICLDECSPCGLSITGDIKIYQWHMIRR